MHKLEVLETMKVSLEMSYQVSFFPLKIAKKAKKSKKPKASFSKARIKDIREEFNESRYKFSKLNIKEIRENLYKIENGKSLSKSKIKEIEKNLTELEENLLKSKKYYEYDDSEYRGIRNVEIYLICQSMKIIMNQY